MVKWSFKKWNKHILVHIYAKQSEIVQKWFNKNDSMKSLKSLTSVFLSDKYFGQGFYDSEVSIWKTFSRNLLCNNQQRKSNLQKSKLTNIPRPLSSSFMLGIFRQAMMMILIVMISGRVVWCVCRSRKTEILDWPDNCHQWRSNILSLIKIVIKIIIKIIQSLCLVTKTILKGIWQRVVNCEIYLKIAQDFTNIWHSEQLKREFGGV